MSAECRDDGVLFGILFGILVVIIAGILGLVALFDNETDPHTGVVVGKYVIPEQCDKGCRGPYNTVVIQTDPGSNPETHYVDAGSYRRVTFGERVLYRDGRLYNPLSPIGDR